MEENSNKNEIIKTLANMEYYPAVLEEDQAGIEKYTKLPLAKVSALGVAFEPLTAAFQNIFLGGGGKSGLYRVTVKNGGHLASFKKENSFLGSVLKENNQVGGGQARLNPLVCDPAMLFMAAALHSIEKKLDDIREAQIEIIEFLEQKEKSKLRGNLSFLTEVMNNYKYNWTNETYKSNNHIKVLDIKQDAEQSILFYREQIRKKAKKRSLLYSDKDVKDKLAKMQADFKEYQLALYLYSFSAFLDVMLLENYAAAFLDDIVSKIEEYAFQYRELYSECYDQIEGDSKSSIQSHLLKGLANINKAAGNAAAKLPVVSKSQLDETLIETSNKLGKFSSQRTEQTIEQWVEHQSSAVHQFTENINTINKLHNEPMELLFDEGNIYFGL